MIDLRSDTVTKPTPGMLAAMAAAPVGDDVYGEDPTVNALEAKVAAFFSATRRPSSSRPGTMANQVAIRVHCVPGDEILTESTSHIVLWEAGGAADPQRRDLSARSTAPTAYSNPRRPGRQVAAGRHAQRPHAARQPREHPQPRRRHDLPSVETVAAISAVGTVARAGDAPGRCPRLERRLSRPAFPGPLVGPNTSTRSWSRSARVSARRSARPSSAAQDLMRKARRLRKLFGGAMRQVGYLAAACAYGMDHHLDRLADDHANARSCSADAVASVSGFTLTPADVRTNMVWFEVDSATRLRAGRGRRSCGRTRRSRVGPGRADGSHVSRTST